MEERTSKAVDNEREEIESYVALHGLEPQLNSVVNDIVKDRPEDPFATMSGLLLRKSERSELILGVSAREILSAQAFPCLQVSIVTIQGIFQATTGIGPFDGDARYEGRGLKKSVDSVTHLIQDKLIGKELNQAQIDTFLSSEPNIPDNVALALSMACCRACAKHKGMELHAYIAQLANVPDPCIPVPCFSLVNGGQFAQSPMFLQELTVMFKDMMSFEESLEAGVRLHRHLAKELTTRGKNLNTGISGGLVSGLDNPADVMKLVTDCATELSLSSCRLGLDMCAASFASSGEGDEGALLYNPARSDKTSEFKSGEELMDMYLDWLLRFNINTMDDLFAQGDTEVMMRFKERIDSELARSKERAAELAATKRKGRAAADEFGDDPVIPFEVVGNDPSCHLQIVGNDLIRSAEDLDRCPPSDCWCFRFHPTPLMTDVFRFHEEQTANTIVLTLRKGFTVTGCIDLAAKAHGLGWGIVVSSDSKVESGETEDDFIAHLAIGIKAGQIRAGGLCSAENMAKYNTLLRIATDETQYIPFAASKFRMYQS